MCLRRCALALIAVALCGCGPPRTPGELAANATARAYAFPRTVEAVRDCMVPALDQIAPFNFPPNDRRPAQVRAIGGGFEIFAQDETITLYVVRLTPQGPRTSAAISALRDGILTQIDAVARRCGSA